jgi:glycosyltransferase involved in cell wall biosynthesis
MKKDVLIIIPAFNEAANIERTVREVLAQTVPVTVLVINDGSVDRTAEIAAQAGAKVLDLPFNLGIGGAVQTGYRYAHENGYDIAVQVDGDGQHDPAYLPQLIDPILRGRADMCVGSRFLENSAGFRSSFSRRVGIRFFHVLIRLLTGLTITDPTSGLRACGRKLIELYAQYYPQDFPEPEAIVVARRMGAKIIELPVVMRARKGGKSSIGKRKSIYYMIKVTLAILLHMIKDRKAYK